MICHRPSVAAAESKLTSEEVQQMVSEWLQNLSDQLRPRIAQLLGKSDNAPAQLPAKADNSSALITAAKSDNSLAIIKAAE